MTNRKIPSIYVPEPEMKAPHSGKYPKYYKSDYYPQYYCVFDKLNAIQVDDWTNDKGIQTIKSEVMVEMIQKEPLISRQDFEKQYKKVILAILEKSRVKIDSLINKK